MQIKIKPDDAPAFAVANSEGLLVIDGGDNDGAVLGFNSKREAKKFLIDNAIDRTHFVVDLTGGKPK